MIKTETINYGAFEGAICFDDEISGAKPGVLVVHTFKGCTDFEIGKAVELAKLGYVALAVDMYGGGRRTDDAEEARALMNELDEDRKLLLERISLAHETLKKHSRVDASKTGAMGYCFGGKCVLDLARAGADLRGAVSFHGVYDAPPMEYDFPVKSSVLVLHGWDDPLNPPSATVGLAEELTARNADWQILSFGNTGHSFTNPNAHFREQGMFYEETSSRRAWAAMERFFAEVFQ